MVRVLVVADEVEQSFYGRRLERIRPDLVLGAGDLSWGYLEFIASSVDAPFLFVPGNHDPQVPAAQRSWRDWLSSDGRPTADPRPHGARNVDLDVVEAAGLRIAGLGGCVRYRPGPNQYSQREYAARGRRLVRRARQVARKAPGGIDILLTHAPPKGCGDGDDRPHEGIEALHDVVGALSPRLLLHGHIHPYGQAMPDRTLGTTTVRNVIPYRVIDV